MEAHLLLTIGAFLKTSNFLVIRIYNRLSFFLIDIDDKQSKTSLVLVSISF